MLSGLGRGLVKQSPHCWHCTTLNQSPVPPAVVSGASTRREQLPPPQSKHLGSSHSMTGPEEAAGAARSRGKKLILRRPRILRQKPSRLPGPTAACTGGPNISLYGNWVNRGCSQPPGPV